MVKQIADIKLYSVEDIHKSLGINERTIRVWFKEGRIKGVKISGEWHITEENLKKFLNAEEGGEIKHEKKTRHLRSLKQTKKRKGDL
ncbi:MAG: helix-turn-helix domain-containing protein [Nitrospinae bacterium]|nr:helix-turn-helix domain-containing protein [Nitrospinota bacterium]